MDEVVAVNHLREMSPLYEMGKALIFQPCSGRALDHRSVLEGVTRLRLQRQDLDHYAHPRNVGVSTRTILAGPALSGRLSAIVMKLQIRVNESA